MTTTTNSQTKEYWGENLGMSVGEVEKFLRSIKIDPDKIPAFIDGTREWSTQYILRHAIEYKFAGIKEEVASLKGKQK